LLNIDHIAIYAQNHYECTYKMSNETGLGNYDGGFFPTFGLGTKIIPLGPDLFAEIEGFVDAAVLKQLFESPGIFANVLSKREGFSGWCFRTDSEEELVELARVAGWGEVDREILGEAGAQTMMTGEKVIVMEAPSGLECWPKGLPNVYFWPDMSKHDSRFPVLEGTGDGRTPLGLAWVEVGGTAAELEAWFGGMLKTKDYPIRFNGKAPGLYAVAVETSKGEVVIRLPYVFHED
jgi:hypothetical protein